MSLEEGFRFIINIRVNITHDKRNSKQGKVRVGNVRIFKSDRTHYND